MTNAEDPYSWQALPEKDHLFKKQLSKHSIGAYRALCRKVGVSFEAVLTTQSRLDLKNKSDEECSDVFSNNWWQLIRLTDHTSLPTKLYNKNQTTRVGEDATRHRIGQVKSPGNYSKWIESKSRGNNEWVHSILQETERDKQLLQQEVRYLTGMMEPFRQTTSKSVGEFLNRLSHDLNLSVNGCGEAFVGASLDDFQSPEWGTGPRNCWNCWIRSSSTLLSKKCRQKVSINLGLDVSCSSSFHLTVAPTPGMIHSERRWHVTSWWILGHLLRYPLDPLFLLPFVVTIIYLDSASQLLNSVKTFLPDSTTWQPPYALASTWLHLRSLMLSVSISSEPSSFRILKVRWTS